MGDGGDGGVWTRFGVGVGVGRFRLFIASTPPIMTTIAIVAIIPMRSHGSDDAGACGCDCWGLANSPKRLKWVVDAST